MVTEQCCIFLGVESTSPWVQWVKCSWLYLWKPGIAICVTIVYIFLDWTGWNHPGAHLMAIRIQEGHHECALVSITGNVFKKEPCKNKGSRGWDSQSSSWEAWCLPNVQIYVLGNYNTVYLCINFRYICWMLSPKQSDETFLLFYLFMRHSNRTPCYPSPVVSRAFQFLRCVVFVVCVVFWVFFCVFFLTQQHTLIW